MSREFMGQGTLARVRCYPLKSGRIGRVLARDWPTREVLHVARDRRKKASEVHAETRYVFSEKVSFVEAFPEIEEIRIEVEQGSLSGQRSSNVLTGATIGEFVDCRNPACYNGGVSIGRMIRKAVTARATEFEESARCQGYEGSPKGRRKYRECLTFFNVQGTIKYKERPSP